MYPAKAVGWSEMPFDRDTQAFWWSWEVLEKLSKS